MVIHLCDVCGELWKECVVHGDDVGDGGGDFDDGDGDSDDRDCDGDSDDGDGDGDSDDCDCDGDSDDGDGDFHWDHPGDSPIHSCFSLSPRANDTSQHLPPTPD